MDYDTLYEGAEWLRRQPLIERLTDVEIELIKRKYKFADVNYYEEQDSHKRDIYMAEKKLLESIFGEEIFKEE